MSPLRLLSAWTGSQPDLGRPRRWHMATVPAAVVLAAFTAQEAGAATRTLTVPAEADTTVKRAYPTTAFGGADQLEMDQADTGGNPRHSYVRFNVPALAAGEGIVGARLSAVVRNTTSNGASIWRTATAWSESTMTWDSGRPARSAASAAGDFGSLGALARVETAVAGVTGSGPISFELAPDTTDGSSFASRESVNSADRPRLVLTISTDGDITAPPDPSVQPPSGTYATAQSVSMSDAEAGATIRYTTAAGATVPPDPTASTGTVYSGPVTVSASQVVKAAAFDAAGNRSGVVRRDYVIGSAPPPEDAFDAAVRHAQSHARGRLGATATRISTTAYPHYTGSYGRWVTTGASGWTSGFFPGSLWLAYQQSADSTWRARAQNWQSGLGGQASNTSTHDVGFMIFDSFGTGYRLTGDDAYRQTVLKAAGSLATRYSPVVGAIRSWNSVSSEFRVIVDNMMNLELLLWASRRGGQRAWYDMAVSHALRTARDHVRPDGSTYHVVIYDPATGAVKFKQTHQGYSASSTWARGQAWAIHGFTMVYAETSDARFLDTARRVADWYVDRLPADSVPYWDFDAPGIPNEPRDSSAAAIAASGLLQLAEIETDAVRAERYRSVARSTLSSLLTRAYLSEGTSSEAILLHGTSHKPAGNYDTGLSYGDYYFQEALLRLRMLPPATPRLTVATVTASSNDGNPAANAIDGDLTTRWSASGDGQWLRLDLGASRRITKVVVAQGSGASRAARFDLQTSSDGTTWTTVARTMSSGTTLEAETYDVPDTTARYVRFVGHGATGTTTNAVTEIGVH